MIQSVTIEFGKPARWLVKIGDKMVTRRRRTMKSKMPDAIAGRLTPEERAWQEMQLSKKVVSLEADLQFMCEEILRMRGHWYLHLTDPSTRYNNPGVPDLIICACGKFLAVELKSQTGTVSGAQHAQMAKIKDNGGEAFVCRSVERFIEILDGLKEE